VNSAESPQKIPNIALNLVLRQSTIKFQKGKKQLFVIFVDNTPIPHHDPAFVNVGIVLNERRLNNLEKKKLKTSLLLILATNINKLGNMLTE